LASTERRLLDDALSAPRFQSADGATAARAQLRPVRNRLRKYGLLERQ
jgi:hypothetical protein